MELTTSDIHHRAPWIDALRIIATVLVVVVHASTYFFELHAPAYSSWPWLTAAAYGSTARVCVPLFFMITGYLLFRGDIEPVSFWRRRISRLAIPWLFWSGIYLVHRRWNLGNDISIYSAVRLMLVNEVYYHLWFLYSLFWIYVAIPFFTPIINLKARLLVPVAVVLWCTNTVILPSVAEWLTERTGFNCHFAVETPVFSGYLGFVLLGFIIGRMQTTRIRTTLFVSTLLLGMILTMFLTVQASVSAGSGDQRWFGYFCPSVVMAACGVFYLGRFLSGMSDRSTIRRLAALTFGVYLVHPLMLEATLSIVKAKLSNSLLGVPLLTAMVLLLSFGVVFLLAKVPGVRRIVLC